MAEGTQDCCRVQSDGELDATGMPARGERLDKLQGASPKMNIKQLEKESDKSELHLWRDSQKLSSLATGHGDGGESRK